jgi:hypothetical protein
MIENMNLRELQINCSKIIASHNSNSHWLSQFNKLAVHNSQQWYQEVIKWYIKEYGDLPDKVGPAKDIKTIL